MRILISGRYLGGAGGAERAMFSMLQALSQDDIDVVIARQLGGSWSGGPVTGKVYNRKNWRWRASSRRGIGTLVNPIRKRLLPEYDIVLMQRWAQDVISPTRASLRLVIPSGNSVRGMKVKFDKVALQAPDNTKFLGVGMHSFLLPPPVLPLAPRSQRPMESLPAEYFLTVFNPYGPIKGTSDLRRAADDSPLPIVWCHSQDTLKFAIDERLARHPKIVHISDAAPEVLRYLYEGCTAYLSFSTSEGFGWAIADALRYSPAIVSRPVGVLSFHEAWKQPGVHLIQGDWMLDWSLLDRVAPRQSQRTLDFLSPGHFRASLANELTNVRSGLAE